MVWSRWGHVVLWVGAAVLLVAAFPLNLLFEVPAALAGRPSDWGELGTRIALVAAAVVTGRTAYEIGPRGDPVREYREVPRWTRRAAHVAVVLPAAGWTVPHLLWVFGVPFGIPARQLADAQAELSSPAGFAIALVPPLFGLLALGLARRWGQRFPSRLPVLGNRPVPRMLAIVPGAAVAIALIVYGTMSATVFTAAGPTWAEIRESWAVVATLLVFVGWGVALGTTVVGYARATSAVGRDDVGAGEPGLTG
ncbi:hypothetical protein [Actinoplanes sp. G11-F43]|uniref:hypothetical protein n=1 Tax=Actinoplanes sp. G11-F43 TaxID=3424130 RepID=UPI003D332CF5